SYKYPFSNAAMEIISSASSKIEEKYLRLGRLRLEEDLSRRTPEFTNVKLNEIKRSIVVSYVYSRMLASALNDRYLLNVYISAESNRIRSALSSEETDNVLALSKELGIPVTGEDGSFAIRFDQFLMNKQKGAGLQLVNRSLDKGKVYLSLAELSE
ncbi:DNA primase large subunit, partial [mine drainage metagenome]